MLESCFGLDHREWVSVWGAIDEKWIFRKKNQHNVLYSDELYHELNWWKNGNSETTAISTGHIVKAFVYNST